MTFWDARIEYGVFADGGQGGTPDQGREPIGVGHVHGLWEQTDGVAHAEALADSTLTFDESASRLFVSLDLATTASATVGDAPSYGLERGIAEISLESAFFDVTISAPALLTVSGEGFGSFGAGTHLLGPGDYTLDVLGPVARATVDVGPGAWRTESASFFSSFEIVGVPAPSGLLVAPLAGVLAVGRRRR